MLPACQSVQLLSCSKYAGAKGWGRAGGGSSPRVWICTVWGAQGDPHPLPTASQQEQQVTWDEQLALEGGGLRVVSQAGSWSVSWGSQSTLGLKDTGNRDQSPRRRRSEQRLRQGSWYSINWEGLWLLEFVGEKAGQGEKKEMGTDVRGTGQCRKQSCVCRSTWGVREASAAVWNAVGGTSRVQGGPGTCVRSAGDMRDRRTYLWGQRHAGSCPQGRAC